MVYAWLAPFDRFDHHWSHWLYLRTKAHPVWRRLNALLRLASNILALPIALWLIWQYGTGTYRMALAFSFIVIFLTNEFFIKELIRRPRPAWSPAPGFAFPSSHSVATGLYFVALMVLPWPWKYALIPFVALIPLSRVNLGYHYLSDVFGGLLVGMAISGLLHLVLI